jgi:hypothetical protein
MMEPQEALRRLAIYCGAGTGMRGYYPAPGLAPHLPAAVVYWTGGQTTYRGGEQELLITADIHVFVADINQADKVRGDGDGLIVKVLDRFRASRDNPAYTLALPGEAGEVKHVHIARGGDEPQPFRADAVITGWKASFYGAVFPVEIKLTREPEQIA